MKTNKDINREKLNILRDKKERFLELRKNDMRQNSRLLELTKLRNEIISYKSYIDRQAALEQLEILEKQCNDLPKSEYQKRLNMIKPTIIVLYER